MGTDGCFCDALTGEAWACAWCGKRYWVEPGGLYPTTGWCNNECQEAHKKANPDCLHFAGWTPIEDTMPGGPHDGVWENSGLKMREKEDET